MSKRIKEYVFLIDKSVSMYGREQDVLKFWNCFLSEQKNQKKQAYVTLGMFADKLECLYIHNEFRCARPLNSQAYYVEGNTAFFDAVCEMCRRIEENLKMLREDIETEIKFFILSDGIDNASVYFDEADYNDVINKQKEKGWKIYRVSLKSEIFSEDEI